MSQQEFERTDQEVMDMVNHHATPEAAENAERLGEEWKQMQDLQKPEQQDKHETESTFDPFDQQMRKSIREMMKKERRRKRWTLAISLILCVVVAALLLVAMYVPDVVIWIVNVGVLSCGIVAAVTIDRHLWRR